ncbi:DUF4386 domain-containing protein [Sporocytophaga myxococcoides]|uniref:DUF4386 domain-containing protein n=1 Tax=Sporocytophaga myxococcoides TaxID=153721 RepID=UPI0004142EE9|nr:DUF4386 domain-containing protein [Sporocytophaga myxococcoides]
MKTGKTIGALLIAGAIGVLVPYTILTIIFDYPDILRQEAGTILTRFHAGGNALIWTWWAFAFLGLPLLPAFVLLGQELEHKLTFIRWTTAIGIFGLLAQMVGLLRWTFVVPVLANNFVTGNELIKEASKVSFQAIHQYGGVVLGEHLGQIFTIIWTVMMTIAFSRLLLFPRWISWLGYTSSFIYIIAQSELFASIMPNVPTLDSAGFIGSTLWIIWLIVIGIKIRRISFVEAQVEKQPL